MVETLHCDYPTQVNHAQLYELLVSELNDFVVFLIDPDGCIVSWNPGVERLLGYLEPEWVQRPAHIIFTPEDRAARKPEEEMATAARDGRAPDIRWHQRKDGSRLFVDGTIVALKDSCGKLLGFSKMMRDITESKRAEIALQASEERFRALLNASSNALYRMNSDWTEMRQLGGSGFIPDTESPNKDWLQEYIHPDDQSDVLKAIQTAVQTRNVFELEHRVWRLDGTLGWTHSRAVPLFDVGGEITEWFGSATDITARKEAEAEREHFMAELARSNEDLSQFTRIASHDLKAPLNTIAQFSQLLLNRYQGRVLDKSAEELLAFVINSAERMTTLTSDLLSYATVSFSPLVPAEPLRASTIVEVALANLQSEIEESGAIVTYNDLPEVKLESTYLVQIFQNLIGNAIKYRAKDAPRIHIAAEKQGNQFLFLVKDNAGGIPREHQERIFEPFKRLHGAEISGSGIGLAICKKVIERAGGRIWVESEPGQGSTFFFTLPHTN